MPLDSVSLFFDLVMFVMPTLFANLGKLQIKLEIFSIVSSVMLEYLYLTLMKKGRFCGFVFF